MLARKALTRHFRQQMASGLAPHIISALRELNADRALTDYARLRLRSILRAGRKKGRRGWFAADVDQLKHYAREAAVRGDFETMFAASAMVLAREELIENGSS